MRTVRIFILLTKQAWKTTFQGRLAPLFFLLGKIVRVVFIFIFISLIFGRTQLVKGYTFNQLLIFYLTFNIVDTLGQILYREVYRFRPMVVSGSFDMVLLKPFHPFVKILLGGIDFLDIILVIPYLFITFHVYLQTGPGSPGQIASYLVFLVNSMILVTAFHILVLSMGILTTDVDHTIMIYRDITGMARFPLEIYQEPIRSALMFLVPVGIMMNIPSRALIGMLTPQMAGFSFVISWGLLGLSLAVWNFSLKKYQSWGG